MNLLTELYRDQNARWPQTGRHILAQYDDDSVIVYQAYRAEIGHFATQHGYFGGAFSVQRMSWIKPNFLWMMYRCGWGTKEQQEVVLAIRLKRAAFDQVLAQAVHSSYVAAVYGMEAAWQAAVARSDVRLQWDPDHHPSGAKLERRAIQLGLRGEALAHYAKDWIVSIEDISDFVREQHQRLHAYVLDELILPREAVYPVTDPATAAKLGLSA
ncbi:MAG: DUF4291 domain-containing protein [Anaerolineae bacterium]|nr:DUF4291 domain-containing protein [Anaerolineae bacterium]